MRKVPLEHRVDAQVASLRDADFGRKVTFGACHVRALELGAVENDSVATALAATDQLALFRNQLRAADRADGVGTAFHG